MKYWIKQRENPQLGTYYVPCGQMSHKAAKQKERGSIYGSNLMLLFNSQAEYNAEIEALKKRGERVYPPSP